MSTAVSTGKEYPHNYKKDFKAVVTYLLQQLESTDLENYSCVYCVYLGDVSKWLPEETARV